MSDQPDEPKDHGEVVMRPGVRISWAWLFPLIAALASGWLFYSNWKSEGIEVEVSFASAPGMEAGKTPLIYRGVVAGIVKDVFLDESLKSVVLKVRLKAFANALAREGTIFWIERPVIGIGQTSGIESLIQGNSLQARMGGGPSCARFTGSEVVPLNPIEEPSLNLKLKAHDIPFLDRGTPIYFRGVQVGAVRGKLLDDRHDPMLSVSIQKEYADLIGTNSRFWSLSGASAKLGAGMLKLDLAGIKALLLGGIAVDCFREKGGPVADGSEFELCADEASARANGMPFLVTFPEGDGLRAGMTELRHLGIPIGLVESISPDASGHMVETRVRLNPGFENFQNEGSTFTLVRPRISLEGVSGIQTLVEGVYINCQPGQGKPGVPLFAGTLVGDEGGLPDAGSLVVSLHAKEIPTIGRGAPVMLRGIAVGRVRGKAFDAENRPVLTLEIRKEFAKTLTRNARFWRVPATSVKAGPGVLNVEVAGLQSLVQGGVAYDVFGPPGEPAQNGARFEIHDTEAAARADSPPIRIDFAYGQGLLAGSTQLRYLGLPVGFVETVSPMKGKVAVTARLESGYDFLRSRGALFTIVRPSISLKGISGMEALVSGVYIECVPGAGGPLQDRFEGVSSGEAREIERMRAGFEVVLLAQSTSVNTGTPVLYRGVPVGKIIRKSLSQDGRSVSLVASIDPPYAPLIRENTRFWDASGLSVSIGFISIKLQATSFRSLSLGGVEFATPQEMGARARPGQVFTLNPSSRPEWLRWAPTVPLPDGN